MTGCRAALRFARNDGGFEGDCGGEFARTFLLAMMVGLHPKRLAYPLFFSKSATNGIPHPFLLVLCECKAGLVVLDDPPPGAKDVPILN